MPTAEHHDDPPADDGFGGEFAREGRVLRSLGTDPVELVDAPAGLWAQIEQAATFEPDESPVEPAAAAPRAVAGDGAAGRRSDGSGTADGAAVAERPDSDTVGGAAAVPLRRRSRRTPVIVSIAAAVVLLGVGVGVVVAGRSEKPAPVASASLKPYGGAAVGSAGGTVRLIRDGDRLRLRVDMHDIPDPAPGTFYEMWLIDPASGSPVSITSMKEGGADVSTVVDVPEGADPSRYDVVDVSVQDVGAGPQHSGRSVLRGALSA